MRITASVTIKISFLHTRIPLLTVSANVSYMEKLSLLLTNLLRNLVVGECTKLFPFIARSVNGFGEQSKTLWKMNSKPWGILYQFEATWDFYVFQYYIYLLGPGEIYFWHIMYCHQRNEQISRLSCKNGSHLYIKMKSRGPTINARGTPQVTEELSDFSSSICTYCNLLERYELKKKPE